MSDKPFILDKRGVRCCMDGCDKYAGPDSGDDPNSVAIFRVSPKGGPFVGACGEHAAEVKAMQREVGTT